jgi:HAD superfamily hydrolase (TIGR01509 family)
MRPPRLVIFDFDGVVADSETIPNRTLAAYLTAKGHPTTVADVIRMCMGKRHEDTIAELIRYIGGPLPDDFETSYRDVVRARMRAEVEPVAGVAELLADPILPMRCVASSSSHGWLDHCVDKFGFRRHFGRHLFSATEVANGKPAPDIFLHAARQMRFAPADTWVLEDSVLGVTGAAAAGMHVIGFLGGGHLGDGEARAEHGARLLEAGAHRLAKSHVEVKAMLATSFETVSDQRSDTGRGIGV